MELIDTHAHVDDRRFNKDRGKVLERARAADIAQIVNIGADIASSRASVALAEESPFVYATVGVHPHSAKSVDDAVLAEMYQLAKSSRVVAIGEIGLDFYRDLSPRPQQRMAFAQQLRVAEELQLPVVIHDRDAHKETTEILTRWARRVEYRPLGVLHCFAGDWEMTQAVIDAGFYIGIDGPVTYKKARRLNNIVRRAPLNRLLIETDCPYLTPEPHRGKRNEPAYVRLVAEKIAEIKETTLEEVARVTTQNARDLFNL